jgi:CBS domain-containing protein
MFNVPIRETMERRRLLKVAPRTLVASAAKLMAKRNVGAAMVLAGGHLVGILTERDVVFRVVARELDPKSTHIADVMTPSPQTIGPEQPLGRALVVMHENGFRHLPVLEHGKLIGVVSARSAMDPELEEFAAEVERRKFYLLPR